MIIPIQPDLAWVHAALQHAVPGFAVQWTKPEVITVQHGAWSQLELRATPSGIRVQRGIPTLPMVMLAFSLIGLLSIVAFGLIYFSATKAKSDIMKHQIQSALLGRQVPNGPGLPGTGRGDVPRALWLGVAWPMLPVLALASLGYVESTSRNGDQWVRDTEMSIEVARINYERVRDGKAFPGKPCPEEKLDQSYIRDCWGCRPATQRYGEPDTAEYTCPSEAELLRELDDSERRLTYARKAVEEDAQMYTASVIALLVGCIGFIGGLLMWLIQTFRFSRRRAAQRAASGIV